MQKQKLQVNVSGGRTSAYMAWWLKENMSDVYDMVFIFANTGVEHDDTYRFLKCVDENFGLNLVIVECVVHSGSRKSSTHKVVTHETLSRDGSPFENEIKKYGISNINFKHCNREMKFNPMRSYVKSIWPKTKFKIAIGIRPDEQRRVFNSKRQQNIIYPLIDIHPQNDFVPDKEYIIDWFKQFDWDLKIPEYLGNCVTCYKKSMKKLNAVYHDNPKHFDFFCKMEEKYGHIKPTTDNNIGNRKWWRGYLSTNQLIKQFNEIGTDSVEYINKDNENGGCSESCEPYEMYDITINKTTHKA